jgi:hypothetical protein
MITMRMVEVIVHEVIHMVAVGDGLVPTAGAVHVPRAGTIGPIARGAAVRVLGTDVDRMLLDLTIGPLMVQVAVVQIIHVAFVLQARVAAAGAVLVGMIRMQLR